jgi:hypothetical protein
MAHNDEVVDLMRKVSSLENDRDKLVAALKDASFVFCVLAMECSENTRESAGALMGEWKALIDSIEEGQNNDA